MNTSVVHGARRGMLSVMAASTLWGTTGVASQIIAQQTPTNALSLCFFRLVIAAPVLVLAGHRLLGKRMWSVSRLDFALMMLIGAFMAVDQWLYFAAISYTGVAVSTLLTICGAPVLVTLLTAIYERQRPGKLILFSMLLALFGTVLLVAGSQVGKIQSLSLLGVVLALGAAAVYAAIILLSRILAGRYHALQVTAVGFSTGAVLLALAASATGFAGAYSIQGWGIILYMGLIPTALAYGLFLMGMRTTPAPIASVLVLLEPLTATFLAWMLFGEQLNLVSMLGTIMLLSAIYLLSRTE